MTATVESQESETGTPDSQKLSGQVSLREILAGLHAVLDNERNHLNSGRMDLLEQFAREKLQFLANLNRITLSKYREEEVRNCQREMEKVNSFLKENLAILKFRMDAISEISKTIKDAVVDAESDGTYEAGNTRNGFHAW